MTNRSDRLVLRLDPEFYDVGVLVLPSMHGVRCTHDTHGSGSATVELVGDACWHSAVWLALEHASRIATRAT